jgi:dihydroflavonol-4-reductase
MTRALVTGATGFVGSAVVRELLAAGRYVRVLVRATSVLSNLERLDVEMVEADLLHEDSIRRGVESCDEVYHVAAFYSTSEEDAPLMYDVNVRGTKNVLNLALEAGAAKIIHTSTIGTIGRPEDDSLPTEETDFNLWDTASHYARSKYLAETVALGLGEQGHPVVVVNPCAPVGPRDIGPSSTGQRIIAYLRGQMPSFVTGGINFIPVEDVARGHLLAAEKGIIGRRYILGSANGNLMLSDFLRLMEKVSGIGIPRSKGPSLLSRARRLIHTSMPGRAGKAQAPGHRPMALTCDPSRAIKELNLPQSSLEEAFSRAVNWFRENGYA